MLHVFTTYGPIIVQLHSMAYVPMMKYDNEPPIMVKLPFLSRVSAWIEMMMTMRAIMKGMNGIKNNEK